MGCVGSGSVPVVLISIAGWMNEQQQQAIEYLPEESQVLREQLGGRRLRLDEDPHRRLAAKSPSDSDGESSL
jgi:hypothetical protein